MTRRIPFPLHREVSGAAARWYATHGRLVFGPGPRKWTFTDPDGSGAVYEIERVEYHATRGPVWCLKLIREWEAN